MAPRVGSVHAMSLQCHGFESALHVVASVSLYVMERKKSINGGEIINFPPFGHCYS